MKIKNLDLISQYESIKSEIDSVLRNVLAGGSFILGEQVAQFESNIADYLGLDVGDVISCASGSDALLLSLMSIDLGIGDEVITTPFSFFATAGCVSRLGAKIVFTDVSDDFNIDADLVEQKITNKTKAIISVDLYGCPCDQNKIKKICQKRGIKFISDSAQSLGSDINGKKIGTIADFTTFSFFPSKNLGCYGDGGLVVCLNKKFAKKIKKLRAHGSNKKYYHELVGINSRLDTIQAAILSAKLPHLNSWTNIRRKIAESYDDGLKIKSPQDKKGHVYHQYTILTKNNKKAQDYLKNREIPTTIYYPLPLHLQKCFKKLGYKVGDFPKSEAFSKKVLSLPMHESLKIEEIDYIIETTNTCPYL